MKKKYQSGQMLLITLLVLSVATTVALSLISRTKTDLSISTQVEESTRAFSAAEAGIEEALKKGSTVTTLAGSLSFSGADYVVNRDDLCGNDPYCLLGSTEKGQTQQVNLDAYPAGNDIVICWAKDTGNVPAIEATLIHGTSGNYQVARYAIDPASRANNFIDPIDASLPTDCPAGTYDYSATLSLPMSGNYQFLRIKPFYYPTVLAVTSDSSINIQPQGNIFDSCGTYGAETTRCINVVQIDPAPASIFDYAIYVDSGSLQ